MAEVAAPFPPSRNPKRKPIEDLEAIQADVASFAASLGLTAAAAAGNSSGFDDSDFRKKGLIGKGGKTNTESAGKDRSEGESGKEKKTKKNRKSKDVAGTWTSKSVKTKPDIREDVSDEEDEVKPKAGNKERGNGVRVDVPSKGVKKGPLTDPVKSKIHEVLDGALAGADPSNTRKRKASWNDLGDEKQGAQPPKRSFIGSAGADQFDSVQKLRVEAQQLMERSAEEYERSRHKDRDAQWLMTARRSGTSADKVAAMTVILQDNPKANVRTLDALIGMLTSNAGKRHAATGIDALKELFMFSLLPDHKLKYFSQQPVATLPKTKERASRLLEWYWEDCLKHRYEKFVLALEEATKDTLFFLKEKALKTVYELLKSKPEQERRLLSALVNKLGDPDRKMASNASYLLSCLLTAHPNMKKVVVDDVEAFVFRPHVGLRARYYAAIFLNQIVHSNRGDGPKLAKQLIDLYFSLFKAVTSVGDDEVHEKKKKGGSERKKSREKGKHKGSVKVKEENKSTDFTMEIDSRLLSALLTGVNRALPYIKEEDLDTVTQENTVLFRLVHSTNFNVAVQALMLLHQLLMKSQAISDRFYRALYSVLLSEGLVKSSKAEMFLGLMFKALKSDVDSRRMSAFAKRLAQVAMHQLPQFACGSLLLLSEILKARPSLWKLVLQPEDHDEEEEHFEDVRDDTDAKVIDNNENQYPIDSSITGDVWPKKGSYDPKHRDPLYCNAHRACWWELSVLACHVHPSVAAMARTLLSGANIVYNGDPLRDLTLGVFLDRFTEKKPKPLKVKQSGTWHGSSLSLPSKMVGALSAHPVGEEFSSLAEDQVAPEDLVFHKFYAAKLTMGKSKLKKKKKVEDEDDVIGGLPGDDVFEGDDSEDEEVDALVEQEASLEMDGGYVSEEGDIESDDDDIMLEEKDEEGDIESDDDDIMLDEEDDGDGSEVDEFDQSEDDEVDGLLEGGLEMSSDDDGNEIAGMDTSLGTNKQSRSSKFSKTKQLNANKPNETVKFGKIGKLSTNKLGTTKAGKISKLGKVKRGKNVSVFQEADSDSEDGKTGKLSSSKLGSTKAGKISKLGKVKRRKKASVFQKADLDSEDA